MTSLCQMVETHLCHSSRRSPLKEFVNAVRAIGPLVAALAMLITLLLREKLPPMMVFLQESPAAKEEGVASEGQPDQAYAPSSPKGCAAPSCHMLDACSHCKPVI